MELWKEAGRTCYIIYHIDTGILRAPCTLPYVISNAMTWLKAFGPEIFTLPGPSPIEGLWVVEQLGSGWPVRAKPSPDCRCRKFSFAADHAKPGAVR